MSVGRTAFPRLVCAEGHLGECAPCALSLAQLRETLAGAGRLRGDDVTPGAAHGVRPVAPEH